MSRERETKRTIFTMTNLVIALVCFVVFLVVGIWAYYGMVRPYLTVMIWTVTVCLAAVGAVAMFLHWYPFAILYYSGCVVGWFAGQWVRQLQGDEFTSNLWKIVIFVVIAVFAALGGILQWKALKKKHDRKKEAKAAAKAQAEADKLAAELEEARKEKEAAEAALNAAAIDVPLDGPEASDPPAGETPKPLFEVPFSAAPVETAPVTPAASPEEPPAFVPPAGPAEPTVFTPPAGTPPDMGEDLDLGENFHPQGAEEEKKGPFSRFFGKD